MSTEKWYLWHFDMPFLWGSLANHWMGL